MEKFRLKNDAQIAALRESGRRLARVMRAVAQAVRPGASTEDLNAAAEREMQSLGGIPVFKGYRAGGEKPFPSAICTSVNNEVVHGAPRPDRVLREGDIIKIDMGLRYQGMITDMARTFPVGRVSSEAETLIRVTEESLRRGILRLKDGATFFDYAEAVQRHVESHGFSVIRDLVGHGVGFELHEDPQIPNYVFRGAREVRFRRGMTVALEPMINVGGHHVVLDSDDWTIVTRDGSLSAHFEDTVIITQNGSETVTLLSERGDSAHSERTV